MSVHTIVIHITAQNSSDIFPLILQTITIAQMLSIGGKSQSVTGSSTTVVTKSATFMSTFDKFVNCIITPADVCITITNKYKYN